MKLEELQRLIAHSIETLGPNANIYFQKGFGIDSKFFDWGEEGKDSGSLYGVTPYETMEHVDAKGNFLLGIKEIDVPSFDLERDCQLIPETEQKLEMIRNLFEMVGFKFRGVLNPLTKEKITVVYGNNTTTVAIEVSQTGFKKVNI